MGYDRESLGGKKRLQLLFNIVLSRARTSTSTVSKSIVLVLEKMYFVLVLLLGDVYLVLVLVLDEKYLVLVLVLGHRYLILIFKI